jgi:hypothetical protein
MPLCVNCVAYIPLMPVFVARSHEKKTFLGARFSMRWTAAFRLASGSRCSLGVVTAEALCWRRGKGLADRFHPHWALESCLHALQLRLEARILCCATGIKDKILDPLRLDTCWQLLVVLQFAIHQVISPGCLALCTTSRLGDERVWWQLGCYFGGL